MRSVAILATSERITAARTSPARGSLLGLGFLTVPSTIAKRAQSFSAAGTTSGPHSKRPRAINRSVAASLGFLFPIVQDLAITRALVQVAEFSHPDEREAGTATRALHVWRERVKQHGLWHPFIPSPWTSGCMVATAISSSSSSPTLVIGWPQRHRQATTFTALSKDTLIPNSDNVYPLSQCHDLLQETADSGR